MQGPIRAAVLEDAAAVLDVILARDVVASARPLLTATGYEPVQRHDRIHASFDALRAAGLDDG
jgi:hypothetical protein